MAKRALPTGDRGVAYVRVSTDQQDKTSQVANIRRWLDHQGLTTQTTYEDVGSRHEAYKRPEFQRMLAAVRAGHIDWIVVDSKDRFGTKNSYEFGKFASELQDHDCELWSIAHGCLTDDDLTTEILAAVDGVRSRDEQLERSRRAVRAMIEVWEKGNYRGSYPPYGMDIACLGPDDREQWRVVYEGHQKRVKVCADGSRERYDGKGNFPAKDKAERLVVVPSRDPGRLEVVQSIFRWFASESISVRGLCTRLNALGIDPIYSAAWYSTRLGPMLRNPAYLVGRTVGNKRGHGDFFEHVGGKTRQVPTLRGRSTPSRKRGQGDYIYPKGWREGEGLIDRTTWDAVQAKLTGYHRPEKAARSSELWLAQFLHCGRCGTRMSGWTQKADKSCPHSYACSTYRREGKANTTGCRLHRVNHRLIAALVGQYLDDTDQKLEAVLTAAQSGPLVDEVEAGLDRVQAEYCRTVTALWRVIKDWGIEPPAGRPWAANTLTEAFRLHSPAQDAPRRAELEELRRTHAEATERYLELPGELARRVAIKRLEELEAKISELQARLQPLDEKLAKLRAELESARERVRVALAVCKGDGNRQKAQALAQVLARVVCHFRYSRQGSQDRSHLDRVVFEPLLGSGKNYAVDPATVADFRGETVEGRG